MGSPKVETPSPFIQNVLLFPSFFFFSLNLVWSCFNSLLWPVFPSLYTLTWCVFLQALMHYAGSRNSIEHGLPLLEVYCLSINCFAAARSHLTAESDRVALVLKRLALWVQTLPHHLFYQQILFNWLEWYSRQRTTLAPNYCFYVQFFFLFLCSEKTLLWLKVLRERDINQSHCHG